MNPPRLDAHQHFWRYGPDYAWIDEPRAALRRDFLPPELAPLLAAAGLDGCVAVQARSSWAETDFLLGLAREHPFVRGVVGWADLCAPDLEATLARYADEPRLVGLRHVVQDEPDDDFLRRDDFQRGVALAARRGLAYDLLIYPRQLPAALDFVRALPHDARLVLDHLGKPDVRAGTWEPWAGQLRELARAPNVFCKVSGLVTEADWHRWEPADLARYLDLALELFGPARLMFGSDWPVCTLASDYARWVAVARAHFAGLSAGEQAEVFGGTAARVYRLG